jgi:hypothetical protein
MIELIKTLVERVVRGVQLALEAVGQRPPRLAVRGRLGQDLVVDVGHVGDHGDLEAEVGQPAAQDVEDDLLADVPDVRGRLHGETAVVDRDLARLDGLQVAHPAGPGVVEAEAAHAGRGRPFVLTRQHRGSLAGTALHP